MKDFTNKLIDLSGKFSKELKIQKSNFFYNDYVKLALLEKLVDDLSNIDLLNLTNDAEKKAFWINIYNGYTNYLIITKKITKKIIYNPVYTFKYKVKIGGYLFSLDDIENGILRKNEKSPYKLMKQFKKNDPRNEFMVEKLDHRIHFALNCGAVSCPPIAFYSSDEIEKQLNLAEKSFSNPNFIIDNDSKKIKCSIIFKAYKKDFIDIYLNDPKYKSYKVSTIKYDWNVLKD